MYLNSYLWAVEVPQPIVLSDKFDEIIGKKAAAGPNDSE